MEACYTQSAPTAESVVVSTRQWLRYAPAAVIVVGLAWRLVRYLGQFPIWGDEAMLLLNILDRDYAELTQNLRFCQVAPLLFLWAERTALLAFGSSEWSMHLFPLLMGVAAFLMFWRTCQASFAPMIAGLAIGILAVSYYPVRHGCEVKPYAFDLCFAVLYLWMALGWLRGCAGDPLTPGPSPPLGRGGQTRWLAALVLVTPFAVFSSYPSVFVGGAVSLVLLPGIRSASWTQRGLYALFNWLLVGCFVVHYTMVGQHGPDAAEAVRAREFLHNYWRDAFPPDAMLQWPIWLTQVFTGNMLAYPLGANRGGSVLTAILVFLGSIALWRRNQRALLALCWLPFALNLLAAILGKYPFGGSARITQHLAPFICVLMAHGLGQILDWVRAPEVRTRIQLAAYVFLLGCGVVGILRDVARPYKTEHDRDVRQLAHDLAKRVGSEEPVILCHASEKAMLAEYLWYLRTQPFVLHWLPQSGAIDPAARSCWLVMCSHQEPSVAEVTSALGARAAGWRVVQSEVRWVPPENAKMAAVYCRWVRLVRD